MLAYDYPLLGIFWTLLMLYLVVAWIVVLFSVIGDVFRNGDIGGFAKALWLLLVLFVPFLGVLMYLIAQGDGMSSRRMARIDAQDAALRS
jgi:hypothetical protein